MTSDFLTRHSSPITHHFRSHQILKTQKGLHALQDYSQHLHDIARIVVDEPDLETLVARLGVKIAAIFGAAQVFIGVVEGGRIHVNAIIVNQEPHPIDVSLPTKDGTLGYILANQKPYRSQAVNDRATPRPALEEMYPCASVLSVPVFNHQNHPLAVIECRQEDKAAPFTVDDEKLLQTIALQIASGIERAQLFRRLTNWNSAMQNLFAFNAVLNEQLDPPILLQRLVEHAGRFLGADAGLAGLVDGGASLVTTQYWVDGRWRDVIITWQQGTIPHYVYQQQCPFLSNNYPDERLAFPPLITRFQVKNVLCVPILSAGEESPLGFIKIHNKQGGKEPFTWSDVSFLESLAHTTAVSLRNARLMQELDRQRHELQALSNQHITLLEDERTHISRELHDEAGQLLIGIKLNLQLLEHQIPPQMTAAREQMRQLREEVNSAASNLRNLARSLRTPALDQLGLQAALQQLVTQFKKQSDLVIYFDVLGAPQRLSTTAETVCYRIVQESLTNVLRHAQAQHVWLTLMMNELDVVLTIRDDGRGFDAQLPTDGLGLLGIRERVAMLGGKFTVRSVPNGGTEVAVRLATEQVTAVGESG